MSPRRLALGLLLDSYFVPAWIYHSIERIVNSDYAEFSLALIRENSVVANKKRKERGNKKGTIPQLYNAIDEKIFIRGNSATEPKNVENLLKNAAVLPIKPIVDKEGCSFGTLDIENIRSYGIDILIRVGFDGLHGNVAEAAKYGIWEYFWESEPHGYWEVMQGLPETTMNLRILTKEIQNSKTIFSCSSLTYPFSPARNRNRSLWKSASFLPRQINSLQKLGEADFFQRVTQYSEHNPSALQTGPELPVPILMQLWLVLKLLIKNVGQLFSRKILLDAWFLMFDLHDKDVPFCDYRKIMPPKNNFWADPHVIEKDENYYVFIEEFDSLKSKGHISVLKVDQSGTAAMPVRVLEKNYHLSYPCVFEWEKHYYMVPESSENRTIDLYECTEFPRQWTHKLTLMENVTAVDNTLLFFQGKWWLFTGISENEGSSPEVELFLFFSDNLFTGEWTAHPLNPLKSDAKNARPAGKIFSKGGKLFRPSQDCSKSYGHGFDLNEILVLSETDYLEKCVTSVRADWDKKVLATHTYGVEGKFKVIDAYTTKIRFLTN